MPKLPQDRLVRKEVALGAIREFEPPQDHIGLSIFPWLEVQSDDVIFEYTRGLTAGLAPARAEDAESELAAKDDSVGTGRASIIDWALKDSYSASDVTRWREYALMLEQLGADSFPLAARSMTEDWQAKLARDTSIRRRKLDNRMEWLLMEALAKGKIVYNDGKIKFTVDYGRPAGQTAAAPNSTKLWSASDSDPIGDIHYIQDYMSDTYGVNMDRMVMSKKIFRKLASSTKFQNTLIGNDPLYTVSGWGPEAAAEIIKRQGEIADIVVYDAVYRTRPMGSNTVTNTRFVADDLVIFLPSLADVESLDDTEVGFGKMLTSPHPEGNFTSGYYEWERSTVDPWRYDIGTGVKAFPVLPHLDKTYVLDVL